MDNIPKHVGIIMDGNGRWAKKRFMPRSFGHAAGVKATKKAIRFASDNGIKVLTIYAFSSENWNRPKEEVSFLMDLFVKSLKKEIKEMHKKQVVVRFIGNRSEFPEKLINEIVYTEDLTKNNTGLVLNIAANYGGRQEIIQGIKKVVLDIQNNKINVDSITEQNFSDYLELTNLPELDLLIRTGGEMRISNFLLWHLAYAELYFSDKLWPSFNETSFAEAIAYYADRERRFGQTSEQIK